MNASALRCGRISFTNDLPVYAAFDLGAMEFPGKLRAGVPTELNRALLDGELDLSPISSFHYIQHRARFTILPFVCIGSRREVRSIYCISTVPPAALAGVRIAVTRDSSTGRALFDTICRESYGFAAAYEDADDAFEAYRRSGAPCLLIGDAAIDAALSAPPEHAHDVGQMWYDLTGANMVYAVWAARNDVAESNPDGVARVMTALRDSVRWSEAHQDRVLELAQLARPRPLGFYEAYYRALTYDFDDEARRGMLRFFSMAAAHGVLDLAAIAREPAPARKVIRYA